MLIKFYNYNTKYDLHKQVWEQMSPASGGTQLVEQKGTGHPGTSISLKLTVFSALALLTFSIQDPVHAALSSRGH